MLHRSRYAIVIFGRRAIAFLISDFVLATDVTGLCKLATPADVKEQDYSLNPGRYVGVVIEEDGKTEEEFIEEILSLNDELEKLNQEAHQLEGIIAHNVKEIAGDN
ncbi:hypothetical protein [Nostoc sp. CCY0012]|uniref:hypothetical protein n=1 Tax=Nostoc sp. CCY0012 TaxID=1056123 RepID=UPI0039C70D71